MIELLPRNETPDFSEFYEQNYARVTHYIHKKIGNPDDAADIASESFLYCFSHYDQFDPEKSSLNTWLYLVVNCRIKNYYRDKKNAIPLDVLETSLFDDRADMDTCMYLEQVTDKILGALEMLPEKQKRIIILRYFQDKTSAEVAEIMGMSSVNVRVQLSRALDKMEKICAKFIRGEG